MTKEQRFSLRRQTLCRIGIHSWLRYQECVRTTTHYDDKLNKELVIGFNICECCAKSKLVHILV